MSEKMSKHTLETVLKRWRKTLALNNVPWMKEDSDAYEQLLTLIKRGEVGEG